jgi:ABC-type multidrug transport system fused ATPase/permease subunit
MNLIELFKRIRPYVYPYRWLVIITLILTLIGSLMAQVNAIVLDRTVDAINALINPEGFAWSKAARILTIITIVLLGNSVMTVVRATNGFLTATVGRNYLFCLAAVLMGTLLGSWAFKHIPGKIFPYIVYSYIGISGLVIFLTA